MKTLVLILGALLAAASLSITLGMAGADYLYELAVEDCEQFGGVPMRLDEQRIMHVCVTPGGIIER